MKKRNDPRLGEIYYVDWNPARGSEQAGTRPAVIVQNNAYNRNPVYPNIVVATMSRSGRDVPTHVWVEATQDNGLTADSYIKCEQLFTLSKDRLGRRLGRLTDEETSAVATALKRLLSLD